MKLKQDVLKVFIGFDSREEVAYDVASFSLRRHASIALEIIPLKQDNLREIGLYKRAKDPLASTEFTYTRFLVPYLMDYQGLALFFDCDFLWLEDVAQLIAEADLDKSVSCVHHDYWPREKTKMDGRTQTQYPRKNWSSLMLFNCDHRDCKNLDIVTVNTTSPKFLHRLEWTSDEELGSLGLRWNWLEGWYDVGQGYPEPAAVHFTRGGPWFDGCKDVAFANLWEAEREAMFKHTK